MKKLIQFYQWLIGAWYSLRNIKPQTVDFKDHTRRFIIKNIEDVPAIISDNTIFIIQDGNEPELIAFKCPCGCNENILLNLLKDARPQWRFRINQNKMIDINPSIWRKRGCKSHFFIKNGIVEWA